MKQRRHGWILLTGLLISWSWSELFVDHYEGNLTQMVDGQPSVQPVSIDVTRKKEVHTLSLKDSKDTVLMNLELTASKELGFLKPKKMHLLIPILSSKAFALKKKKDCFVGEDGFTVELCFEDSDFSVRVKDKEHNLQYILSASAFKKEEPVLVEEPRSLTLDEAIERAITQSFQALTDIEKAFQAKKGAEEQYLNLLPHLSGNSIVSIVSAAITGSPSEIFSSIGDLAPFLLPNRWLQAKEAEKLGEASEIASILMRADLATQVQGLAYAFEKDRKIHLILNQVTDWLWNVQQKMLPLEQQKLFPEGSTAELDLLVKSLELEVLKAQEILEIDRGMFSQTLGYFNPETIDFVEIGEDTPLIKNAKPEILSEVTKAALSRSFELKQMDAIIAAAQTQHSQIYFSWLDPQGGTHDNIGMATGTRLAIASSRVKQLEISREQIREILVQNAWKAVNAHNRSVVASRYADEVLQGAGNHLADRVDQLLKDHKWDRIDFQAEVESYLAASVTHQTWLATYRIAKSKIQRMKLSGTYQRFLDQDISP